MNNPHPKVIVIEDDPMMQKGLTLLLQGLHCEAIIMRNNDELKPFLKLNIECPQLIIVSISLRVSALDINTIEEIRVHYQTDIPVIFLEHEHSFEIIHNNKCSHIYFSDGSKPKQLRKSISKILNQMLSPLQ